MFIELSGRTVNLGNVNYIYKDVDGKYRILFRGDGVFDSHIQCTKEDIKKILDFSRECCHSMLVLRILKEEGVRLEIVNIDDK